MKIYLVFFLDYLYKATKDSLPRQYNELLLSIYITKDNKWEVKNIIAIQKNKNKL